MAIPFLNTENTFIQLGPGNEQLPIRSTKENTYMHYVALPSNEETCSMQQLFNNSLVSAPSHETYKKEEGTSIGNVYKHVQLNLHEGILPLQINRFATQGGRIKQANGVLLTN